MNGTTPASLTPAPLPANLPAVRFAPGQPEVLEGLGMPWGGPHNGQDLYQTHFSKSTDFAFSWFPDRPLLFQHGLDAATGIVPVGRVKSATVKPDLGVWVQAQLDASNEYFESIKELVKRGKLYFSSGAMSHLVDVDAKSGEIRRWPWCELSLTPTPANLFATLDVPTARQHFRAIGLELPPTPAEAPVEADDGLAFVEPDEATRATWTAAAVNNLPDSAFGYIEGGGSKDSEGKTTPRSLRHFPHHGPDGKPDAAHVRNALARIPQSSLPAAAKASALAHVRKHAAAMGIGEAGDAAAAKAVLAIPTVPAGAPGALRSVSTYPGSYEERIADLTAALNPMTPWGMAAMGPSCVLATYDDYCIVERCELEDDGDMEMVYYRVPYTLDADGDPTLGAAEQVEPTWATPATLEPVVPEPAGMGLASVLLPVPLALYAQHTSRAVETLTRRSATAQDAALREGRVLSTATRRVLEAAATAQEAAAKALRELLTATEAAGPAGRAATLARLRLWRLTLAASGAASVPTSPPISQGETAHAP